MSEKSFFEKTGPYKLKILSDHINGKLNSIENSDILIDDISSLNNAKDSEITFFSNLALKEELKNSSAGACVISELNVDFAPKGMPLIFCDDPYMGFALISQKFYPKVATSKIVPAEVGGDQSSGPIFMYKQSSIFEA